MRRERLVLDQLEDGQIVAERPGRRNHFDKIGLKGFDPRRRLVQTLGARKVVKAHQQRRAGLTQTGSEPSQLRQPSLFGRLHFEIHNLAAGFGSFQ